MSNTLRIEGFEELNATLRKLPAKLSAEATKVVNSTAMGVRNTAVQSILRPSPPGRTYVSYKPKKVHVASSPGSPPNSDTGLLASLIVVKRTGQPSAEVISNAEYSKWLEFGTTNMKARPFMTPAVMQEKPKFEKKLRGITRKLAK